MSEKIKNYLKIAPKLIKAQDSMKNKNYDYLLQRIGLSENLEKILNL